MNGFLNVELELNGTELKKSRKTSNETFVENEQFNKCTIITDESIDRRLRIALEELEVSKIEVKMLSEEMDNKIIKLDSHYDTIAKENGTTINSLKLECEDKQQQLVSSVAEIDRLSNDLITKDNQLSSYKVARAENLDKINSLTLECENKQHQLVGSVAEIERLSIDLITKDNQLSSYKLTIAENMDTIQQQSVVVAKLSDAQQRNDDGINNIKSLVENFEFISSSHIKIDDSDDMKDLDILGITLETVGHKLKFANRIIGIESEKHRSDFSNIQLQLSISKENSEYDSFLISTLLGSESENISKIEKLETQIALLKIDSNAHISEQLKPENAFEKNLCQHLFAEINLAFEKSPNVEMENFNEIETDSLNVQREFIRGPQNELSTSQNGVKFVEKDNHTLDIAHLQLEDENKHLVSEIMDLKCEINILREINENLSSIDINALEQQSAQVQEENRNLEGAWKSINEISASSEIKLKTYIKMESDFFHAMKQKEFDYHNEIETLRTFHQTEIMSLNHTLFELNEQMKSTNILLDDSKRHQEVLKCECDVFSNSISAIENDLTDKTKLIESIKLEYSHCISNMDLEHSKSLDILKASILSEQCSSIKAKELSDNLLKEISSLHIEKDVLIDSLDILKGEKLALAHKNEDSINRIQELENLNDARQQNLERSLKLDERSKIDLDHLFGENELLKNALEELKVEYSKLYEENQIIHELQIKLSEQKQLVLNQSQELQQVMEKSLEERNDFSTQISALKNDIDNNLIENCHISNSLDALTLNYSDALNINEIGKEIINELEMEVANQNQLLSVQSQQKFEENQIIQELEIKLSEQKRLVLNQSQELQNVTEKSLEERNEFSTQISALKINIDKTLIENSSISNSLEALTLNYSDALNINEIGKEKINELEMEVANQSQLLSAQSQQIEKVQFEDKMGFSLLQEKVVVFQNGTRLFKLEIVTLKGELTEAGYTSEQSILLLERHKEAHQILFLKHQVLYFLKSRK
jgi:hypothetical protein